MLELEAVAKCGGEEWDTKEGYSIESSIVIGGLMHCLIMLFVEYLGLRGCGCVIMEVS